MEEAKPSGQRNRGFAVFLSLFLVASTYCGWVSKALEEILPSILSQKSQSGIASAIILCKRLVFLGLGSVMIVRVRMMSLSPQLLLAAIHPSLGTAIQVIPGTPSLCSTSGRSYWPFPQLFWFTNTY